MNDLFKTVNIEDSRVSHIKSTLPFAVLSGSAQNTYQAFGAISQNPSTITYNIQVPSMSTVIDRNVLHRSTITLRITCGNVANGVLCLDYGSNTSLQAFPLNSLVTTQTATINNTSVTTNLQDVLPQILRMYDNETLQRYNSLSPAFPDTFWQNYSDAIGSTSNPMAGLNNAGYDLDLMPRGAFPVAMQVTHNIHGAGVDNSLMSTNLADTWVILLTFTVVEPVLGLTPFCHSDTNDQAGFLGINNLTMTFNLDGACKRVLSTSSAGITGVTINSVIGSQILLNFLSLQPEQYGKIEPRNVLPYQEISRYIYNSNNTLLAPAGGQPLGNSMQYNFSNIQLNQIPDLMILCARLPMANQNWATSNYFLTIQGISMNFDNHSGILSSASQEQLYLMGVKNGSSQTFYEFAGYAMNNDNNTGTGAYIPTLGSMLVLNPALDFGLPSMYTASSGGQFNFQCTLTIANQTSANIVPEIVLITVNSGLFVTENGTSQVHTGILTRDVVLDTKNQHPVMDTSFYHRLIGGSLHNIRQLGHVLSGKKITEETGAGTSAGAMSAGSMTQRRHGRKVHKYA